MIPSPLRVFVADDEAPARRRLATLLEDIAAEVPNRLVGEAENGRQALEELARARADVALVDIRMPDMDGIELARHLGELETAPAVIFVTAYDQYAVKAFELNAIDYLLKPVRAQRLAEALKKAIGRAAPPPAALRGLQPAGRTHLSCMERGRLLLVGVADILYLKAELKYVTARTREREYLLEEPLAHLEEELGESFVRVHRNCLVARKAIAGFERAAADAAEPHWWVLLHGLEERLPISRRQWPAVRASLGLLGDASH